mmetsp:Transcript_18031/g.51226  ORF Transcript_18031/g.51226 Transcript_18031/m.51226 type:complete len:227 (-) Transcript_18031:3091-3771(-)
MYIPSSHHDDPVAPDAAPDVALVSDVVLIKNTKSSSKLSPSNSYALITFCSGNPFIASSCTVSGYSWSAAMLIRLVLVEASSIDDAMADAADGIDATDAAAADGCMAAAEALELIPLPLPLVTTVAASIAGCLLLRSRFLEVPIMSLLLPRRTAAVPSIMETGRIGVLAATDAAATPDATLDERVIMCRCVVGAGEIADRFVSAGFESVACSFSDANAAADASVWP